MANPYRWGDSPPASVVQVRLRRERRSAAIATVRTEDARREVEASRKLCAWTAPAIGPTDAPPIERVVIERDRLSLVWDSLVKAKVALVANHEVLATDRPNLPLAPGTGWTTNFLREIAAIDDAKAMLAGGLVHIDPGCTRCSTHPRSGTCKALSTLPEELRGSHIQLEARS